MLKAKIDGEKKKVEVYASGNKNEIMNDLCNVVHYTVEGLLKEHCESVKDIRLTSKELIDALGDAVCGAAISAEEELE